MTQVSIHNCANGEVAVRYLTGGCTVVRLESYSEGVSVGFFVDPANAHAMRELGAALVRSAEVYLNPEEEISARGESPPLYIAN